MFRVPSTVGKDLLATPIRLWARGDGRKISPFGRLLAQSLQRKRRGPLLQSDPSLSEDEMLLKDFKIGIGKEDVYAAVRAKKCWKEYTQYLSDLIQGDTYFLSHKPHLFNPLLTKYEFNIHEVVEGIRDYVFPTINTALHTIYNHAEVSSQEVQSAKATLRPLVGDLVWKRLLKVLEGHHEEQTLFFERSLSAVDRKLAIYAIETRIIEPQDPLLKPTEWEEYLYGEENRRRYAPGSVVVSVRLELQSVQDINAPKIVSLFTGYQQEKWELECCISPHTPPAWILTELEGPLHDIWTTQTFNFFLPRAARFQFKIFSYQE